MESTWHGTMRGGMSTCPCLTILKQHYTSTNILPPNNWNIHPIDLMPPNIPNNHNMLWHLKFLLCLMKMKKTSTGLIVDPPVLHQSC
eukprot:15359696-Ditylum_brightwellii.AAC.2